MALYKYIDLDEKAILNFSDFYVTPKNDDFILQRFDRKILTRDHELEKNIFFKLKDNEYIGILIVDYNMISLIERIYNSIDFKRMIFIFVSDWCRQKFFQFGYDALHEQIEKVKKDTKNNIVRLLHYNGSGVEYRLLDKEYEEVF